MNETKFCKLCKVSHSQNGQCVVCCVTLSTINCLHTNFDHTFAILNVYSDYRHIFG